MTIGQNFLLADQDNQKRDKAQAADLFGMQKRMLETYTSTAPRRQPSPSAM